MKTQSEILTENTCQQLWEKIYQFEKEKGIDLGAYGNGFDRMGKIYFYQILRYFPEYKEEILSLF
jgi:hypothetical protein